MMFVEKTKRVGPSAIEIGTSTRDDRRKRVAPSGCLALALVVSLSTSSADAHHSIAMFDQQKQMTLTGTVRTVQWTNPHCWIQLLVPQDTDPIEWSIEMGAPSQLFNMGWRPKTLKPGDKIIVTIHPMRDGSNGGVFISATDVGGRSLTPTP